MNDHLTILQNHFLFRGAEELLPEALSLPAKSFQRGEIICDPATAQQALGIMLRGRAEALAAAREQTVLAAFGPGNTFGAAALFGGAGMGGSIPTTELTREDLAKDARVTTLLAMSKIAPSNSAARRLIQGGGVAVNDEKVTDVNAVVTEDMFAGDGLMLRSGKKKFHRFTLK